MVGKYQELANAAVVQAARDYEEALCNKALWDATVKELEEFFTGDLIAIYTKVSGPDLLHKLQANVEQHRYDYKAITKSRTVIEN